MMQMLKHCLNWKVIAGLAAVGVGFYAVAPNLAVAALPFLILAICPLSMMFMMKGMQGNQSESEGQQISEDAGADLTREQQISRMRTQQADLADRIESLERDEPQPARNGKGR